jgi:hypothetical protein
MIQFIATYNELALAKFKDNGIRPHGRALGFFEDDEKMANAFFRRYTRNLYGVQITKADFSLYAPNWGEQTACGFQGAVG